MVGQLALCTAVQATAAFTELVGVFLHCCQFTCNIDFLIFFGGEVNKRRWSSSCNKQSEGKQHAGMNSSLKRFKAAALWPFLDINSF